MKRISFAIKPRETLEFAARRCTVMVSVLCTNQCTLLKLAFCGKSVANDFKQKLQLHSVTSNINLARKCNAAINLQAKLLATVAFPVHTFSIEKKTVVQHDDVLPRPLLSNISAVGSYRTCQPATPTRS